MTKHLSHTSLFPNILESQPFRNMKMKYLWIYSARKIEQQNVMISSNKKNDISFWSFIINYKLREAR